MEFFSEPFRGRHVVDLDFDSYLARDDVQATCKSKQGRQFRETLVLVSLWDCDQFVFNGLCEGVKR